MIKVLRNTRLVLYAIALLSACTEQGATSELASPSVADSSASRQADAPPQLKFTSMVRSIFEDSKGNYWFGSDREGLARYDGKSFTYFDTQDGLAHNQIRTIQEDAHGQLWFATGYGVSSYADGVFRTHTVKQAAAANFAPSAEWKKAPHDLWFNGELEGGIYRYDGRHFEVYKFPESGPNPQSTSIKGTVTGISPGKNNMLWMAGYNGVIGYNGKTFTFINEPRLNYHVRSILEDSQGRLWIGNNGIGVLMYDGNKTSRLADNEALHALSPEAFPYHVFSITEDRAGNIWIGDRDTGAWRFDGQDLINYSLKDGLTSNFVRVIYTDKQGKLWFGLDDGNVFNFNGTTFEKAF